MLATELVTFFPPPLNPPLMASEILKNKRYSIIIIIMDPNILRHGGINMGLTKPIKYGLPASPKACEINIWKASAVDRLVGKTTYC